MNHLPLEKFGALSQADGPPGMYPLAPQPATPTPPRIAGFRTKVLLTMMLLVGAITALVLYFAQRSLAASVERDLEQAFQATFDALHNSREIRQAALMERSIALTRKQRIHAALEDNALDLLYLNARDELRDVVPRIIDPMREAIPRGLRAQFYRFLDRDGAVISPADPSDMGSLAKVEEARLALPAINDRPQIGYLARVSEKEDPAVSEIIAMPLASTMTGEPIGALVLGFEPFEFSGRGTRVGMKSGVWLGGRLYTSELPAAAEMAIAPEITHATEAPVRLVLDGTPHLLFAKRLNPGSLFPPAYEVCLFPLHELIQQQRQLGWRVVGAGGLLLLLGLGASHFASGRLSAPVEKLAVDSERSARFSADASHQLKTPVTVLRAGLEELLTNDNLTPEECHQLSALIHQTFRLSSLIEDLLLLSRMDAGRLKLSLLPVNLTELIEASLDDLSALPDELGVAVETDFPAQLSILGEKRYTAIILQNLLENARKYNRRGGKIRIVAHEAGETVRLAIANTGQPISAAAQLHIFERFHRGAMGENVPGYGLGLNLARELARLHQGELQLVRTDESWTEFEVRFRAVRNAGRTSA